MIHEISIKNFAIIDNLNIRFSDGLTILSGETGAGKSIIINAINLLLGSRASVRLVRSGAKYAEIEALFHIQANTLPARLLEEHGYVCDNELLVRRVVSTDGKNSIYINGRMANGQILSAITDNLASISGQHAHQGLLREEHQLLILDKFEGLLPLRQQVQDLHHQIQPLILHLDQLNRQRLRQAEQVNLLEFQRKEITEAAIEPDEDRSLETEKARLKNADLLYATVYQGIEALYSGQGAVIEQLSQVDKSFQKAARIDPGLEANLEKINEASYLIEDITQKLQVYLQAIRPDPGRLEAVEERLDVLNKLKRKYGGSLDTVFTYLETIDRELADLENLADKITETENSLSQLHRELSDAAGRLSKGRQAAAHKLSKKVEAELKTLKMKHTRFIAEVSPLPAGSDKPAYLVADGKAIGETGWDRVTFLIAPNVGETLKPLAAIASGGELSRIVLALKAILAARDAVETVVFDEVDAGIGGGVAEVVGKKLVQLARYHQVICITHLPQIAKFGRHHFRISKHVKKGRTLTRIEPIHSDDRVNELARMLGGENITPTTVQHAREMLEVQE
jgi:DNA repair protein RecN (Recombination protein N)